MTQAALITGAARRIGREIALCFAQAGHDIALHYHRSEADAQATAAEIRAMGRQCVLLRQNLRDLDALPALVTQAKTALPGLRVLVNNASTFRRVSFANSTPATVQEDFADNFLAPYFLTQAFAQATPHAAIVNLIDASVATQRISHFAYLLAKKNLAEFTQMAALALAPDVTVNAICPGFILPTEGEGAEMHDPNSQPCATAQEVAAEVLRLAIDPALTGQLIFMDGKSGLK